MYCENCGNQVGGNSRFCTKCGLENKTPKSKENRFFTKKKILILIVSVFILFAFLIYFYPISQSNREIASSVVNIYCEGVTEESSFGGSGTIFTEDGIVLTNAHIIPTDEEVSCIVTLPDPKDGSPKEIYTANPIVIPELSEKYDLAFLEIHDVYYDQVEGRAYGEYPKKFKTYSGGDL